MEKSDNPGKYPKHVFLIILNEFCERFSFYGLKTVLYLYFYEFIGLDKDTSLIIYHIYVMLCYFSPVIGAIIADGYIGLYKTIVSLSIIYLIGEIIVTLTSIIPLGAPNLVGPCIGLIIIAIGTGGIKPCVSAFGGNQFEKTQTRYIETFFSVFYLSINVGSTIATLVTPIFRGDIKCFGNNCYPLAFGVPAIFMFISIIFFILGSPFYNKNFSKGKGNIIIMTVKCIIIAIRNKISHRKDMPKKKHWLDYAEAEFDSNLISSVKAFCKVLLVFVPVPIFWALYDQQGSRWTSQAQQLNGRIGSFTLKPDQFQAVNPIFIVALVPLFDYVIYPFLSKYNLLKKQLQRMGIGLILAILSFVIAAILELQMQNEFAKLNLPNQIKILNTSPCNITILNNENDQVLLDNMKKANYLNNNAINLPKDVIDKLFQDISQTEVKIKYSCDQFSDEKTDIITITNENLPKTLIFHLNSTTNKMQSLDYPYETQNNKIIGKSQLKFSGFNINDDLLGTISSKNIKKDFFINDINQDQDFFNYTSVDYRKYEIKIKNLDSENDAINSEVLLETCGRYTVLIFRNPFNNSLDYSLLTDIYPNGLHISWQLIQIFVMTIAEIMFAISGVSFAYSQAPASMKSVLQATWYFTIAIGNLIVVIVAEAKMVDNQVWEYIIFAFLLAIATIVFIILAYFYKYEESLDHKNNSPKTEGIEINKHNNKIAPMNLDDSITKI